MRDWFTQLAQREQLVLGVGALLAIVIVTWTFVWSPLRDGTAELEARVDERAREVIDLKRAAALESAPATGTASIDSTNILFLIDETARQLGLESAFTRSSPDGPNSITVSFTGARFDLLLGWLIDLEQVHGVAVVRASFTHSGSDGFVNGQVRLDRS